MYSAMNHETILCAACKSELWSKIILANGQPVVVPMAIRGPHYGRALHMCPICMQEAYVSRSPDGREYFLMRNEETNRLHVA